MKTIAKHILRLRHACLRALPLLLFPLGACVAEEGECPVDTHEDDIAVSLVIKGNLPAAGSRAALSDLDGTLAESYININDLYILAFEIDPTKGVADGESKLKDIIWSPQQAERLPESSISSNGTVVLLRTFLSSEKYKEDEPFALVAVSNISNWGGESYTLSTEKDKETTLADLQKTLTYPIVMDSRWVPDNAKSDGIPLFGIKRCSLSGYNPQYNNSANPYNLGTTWLLRTLAKIELFTAADSKLEIASAQVVAYGWNNNVQLIPFMKPTGSTTLFLNRMEGYNTDGSDTYGSTSQVNLSPDFTTSGFTPTASSYTLNFSKATVKKEDGTTAEGFVAYLPEYQLASTDGTPRNQIVKISFEGKTQQYTLTVAPYDNYSQPDTNPTDIYWQYLLRNYLYRFQIQGIQEDATLSLKYTVCPMQKYTTDIPDFN